MCMQKNQSDKEIKQLGIMNSWKATPEIVQNCNHVKTYESISKNYSKITCETCGYTYSVDSGD